MLQWLRPKQDSTVVDRVLDSVRQLPGSKVRSAQLHRPWLNWPPSRKESVASQYRASGYLATKLQLGRDCPPASTFRTWAGAQQKQRAMNIRGRPTALAREEEAAVAEAVQQLRTSGNVVDSEVLILLGRSVVAESRGPAAELPSLTASWAQGYRRRWKLSKVRKSSTDRVPLTPSQTIEVNMWRSELQSLAADPYGWGLLVPAGFSGAIPEELLLAADETPLHYIPQSRGPYSDKTSKAVYVVNDKDKRQVTGNPVVNRRGDCPVFQIIWRGKTQRCVPRCEAVEGTSSAIYHDYAPKKCQTAATWARLLGRIAEWASAKRKDRGLVETFPAVLGVDNVASHMKDTCVRVGASSHLYGCLHHTGLYLYFGLPGVSHLCNRGDQLVNSSLRRTVRQQTKLRAMTHSLQVCFCMHSHVTPLSRFLRNCVAKFPAWGANHESLGDKMGHHVD